MIALRIPEIIVILKRDSNECTHEPIQKVVESEESVVIPSLAPASRLGMPSVETGTPPRC